MTEEKETEEQQIIKLSSKDIEEYRNLFEWVIEMEKIIFKEIPINQSPHTTALYNNVREVKKLLRAAINTGYWNTKNSEFVIKTIEELRRTYFDVFPAFSFIT